MIARVYLPEAAAASGPVEVPADEARWLRDVLRLRAGAAVRIFDGQGGEWDAVLASIGRDGATITRGAARTPPPEPRVRYTVVMPALKGDAADEVVRDVVMMGASAIVPVVTARTEIGRAALERGQRQARWQRVAVASAKQSGRAVVPAISAPQPFDTVMAAEPGGAVRLLFVEPAVGRAVRRLTDLTRPDAVMLATGPEGGWTDDEVRAAEAAGWILVRLGGRVLRAESAPLVAMAACQAVWPEA